MAKAAKNKGPKGKKARRAAKLERHWGERANEDEIQKARIRKGKSRLLSASNRMKSNPKLTGKANEISPKEVRNIEESGNESFVDFSDDESLEDIGQGRLLNHLLQNIKGKYKPSNHDHSMESHDDNFSGRSIESDSDDSQSFENSDETCDGIDPIEFDFERMKAKGPNPYLHFYSQDPCSAEDLEMNGSNRVMKRLKLENIDENVVIQVSESVKTKFAARSSEQCHSMDAFSHVRKEIAENWAKTNIQSVHKNADGTHGIMKKQPIFSEFQAAIYPMIANYCDSQISCMTKENRTAIENLLILHILNHVLSANNDITSHNNQLRELEKRDEIADNEYFRDQGYTRPKVLLLLPTKSIAYSFVKAMLAVLGENSSIENEAKFRDEYGPIPTQEESDKLIHDRRRTVQKAKGNEWLELFGDGVNSDDDFKIGLSMSNAKKTGKKQKNSQGIHVKLFSDFYHSDIIIASPIGLRMIVNDEEDKNEEDVDIDFLSSIEVIIAHHSDVLLMQNWDHMGSIMEKLNQQPKRSTGIDFSRVRNYLLHGQASMWRQSIVVSRFIDPHLSSTFNRFSSSLAGKIKVRRKIPSEDASICNVLTKVRQVFQRISCDSIVGQGESKVKYFQDTILPQLIRTKQSHTLIYIPSYFDFITVRNILLKNEIASYHFVSVTEYSRVSEVSRGRARFLRGEKRIMLYTGRAHFFMRHHIKGAKHLILLGLPENANFYPELLNMLSGEVNNVNNDFISIESPVTCMSVFTKYDAQSLERIVGTKHSERMVKSEKKTFLFNS